MKKQNGITLIALVVTIILLLILAAVTISVILGDSGIFRRTTKVTDDYEMSSMKEEIATALTDYYMERRTNADADIENNIRNNVDPSKIKSITVLGDVVIIESTTNRKYTVNIETGDVDKQTDYDEWDGSSITAIGLVGKGSSEEPYLIRSVKDLNYFKARMLEGYNATITGLEEDGVTPNNVNLKASISKYRLTTNIALNDTSNYSDWTSESFDRTTLNKWKPIGKDSSGTNWYSFFGEFDGAGHEITGMYIEENFEYLGFFAAIGKTNQLDTSAVVKNLRITNSYVKYSGNRDKAAFGGIAAAAQSGNTISNCYFSGIVEGKVSTGGIVGEMIGSNSLLENCQANAIIKGTLYSAGIAGKFNTGTIKNCKFTGEVYGTQEVGGIVGESYSSSIENCTSNATIRDVESSNAKFGGIIGNAQETDLINCSNEGKIEITSAVEHIGGIAGLAGYGDGTHVIINCHNKADITAVSDYVGGIVGDLYRSSAEVITVENCTNTGTVTSNKTHVGDMFGFQTQV